MSLLFQPNYMLHSQAKWTSLNGNPSVLIGQSINITVSNATGVGAGPVTLGEGGVDTGEEIIITACHTANRFITWVDTSDTVKTYAVLDAGAAAAESIISAAFFKKQSP